MKLEYLISLGLLGLSAASAVVSPDVATTNEHNELWKRKGGGGGGGRGGGGGGGRSSGGSRGSGGSSPPKAGQPGFKGAGAPRSFGGGKFYGAGSGTPYKAGGRSPGGILPALVVGGAIGLAFWPGLWLHGAYLYNYPNNYRFRNDTTDDDEDLPVICGCDPESLCGCDENDDERYVSDLVGTGEWDQLNKSLVTVADVNGTKTLLINGTLPEGTEPPVPGDGSGAAGLAALAEALGYWPMVAAALASVYVA